MNGGLDWSIGQRLGAGFALLVAVLASLGGALYYWNAKATSAQEAFSDRIAPLGDAADVLERRLLQIAIAVRAYAINPGPDSEQRRIDSIEAARSALRTLEALPMQSDGQLLFAAVRNGMEAYFVRIAGFVVAVRGGTADSAAERALAGAREEAVAAVRSFRALQRSKTRAALDAIEQARRTASQGIAAAVVLAALLFACVALVTIRSVRNPARELVRVSEALERGDWKPALAWAPERNGGPPRAVRDEMLKLANAFGAAASALERREQRLRADRQVASATGSSLSREDIGAAALGAVCAYLGAEVGALYMKDPVTDMLLPVATHATQGVATLAVGEGIPGQAAKARAPVVVSDIPPDSGFDVKLGYDQAPPRCVAAVPVAVRDELVGVLLVASLRDLGAEAISFLESAAAQLAIGLQNVNAYDQIRRLLAEVGEKNQQIQAQNEELQAQNEELQAQGEEIQAQNEELQAQSEEIQAQNDQLQSAAEQLRSHASSLADADRRKTEFLAVLAHELRNPMAAISNSLYMLAKSPPGSEVRQRAQQVIDRQTRLLARLVDDLLDVTRIGSGKVRLHKEPVDLVDVVRECAEDYRGASDRAGLALRLELPATSAYVEGDRIRLCQIVGNLIDNALKFGDARGEVAVSLAIQPERSQAELRIADQGVGFAPEMQERLFQPFAQADTSLARHKSGLGLGLALVKALAELHGGSVRAHSDGLGKGAEFVVRLPLAPAAGDRPAAADVRGPATSKAPAKRRRRILIIEDNADAATTLKDSMELQGHQVRVATDALQGIRAAYDFQPDVVLCDIGLPSMDGYQLASRFRADERLKSIFLVAVTGYAAPEDQERAAQAGFDRHFGKPPDIDRLQQLLDELAGR